MRTNQWLTLAVCCFSLVTSCKKKPAKSAVASADSQTVSYLNLESADGRLRSVADVSVLPACDDSRKGHFSFIAANKMFYRCSGKENILIPDTSVADGCRSYKITADIASTGGAQELLDVAYFGVRCDDGDGYLINVENGLIPKLMDAAYNSEEKKISLRATRIVPRTGSQNSLIFSRTLKLSNPLALKVSELPEKLQILPGGDASFGQFVYVRINDGAVYCSYRSLERDAYKFMVCKSGTKTMESRSEVGLMGGEIIDKGSGVIKDVSTIDLIVGSTAINYITSVDFVVVHN